MTRKSTQDDLLSDDPFYTVAGNSIQGSYIPASSGSSGGGSTTGSVMSATSGGITINLILDAAAQAAPASFKNGLQQAVSILAANITDKITVNINIDYSGTGGGAAAGPDNGYYESYAWTRSELVNNASAGDTTFNSLPTGSTIQGQSNVAVWNAELKLWGVLGANDTTTDDASANFSTDINSNLLVGVALHELTHAMARVPYGSAPDVFDLFRFTSPGVRLFSGSQTAPAAYFSLDGGSTKLADYGQNSDPSDFLNSGVQGANDPFNEYYTSTTLQGLTSVDLQQLDALGFHLAAASPTTIEAAGVTTLVQAGSYYFLDPVAGGAGPSLKYGGAPIVVGQFSPLAPIAAEQVGSGYDVAWKAAGADQYTVWSVDSNGNYVSTLASAVSGTSATLESYETTFHQDLNGDGTIGIPTTVVSHFTSHSPDFNGDGNTDLLLLNDGISGVAVWELSGTQVLANPQVGTMASGFHFAKDGDFNGDGKTDLLMLNDSTHDAQVWLTNGTQISATGTVGTISAFAGWGYADVGDFNGDGKSDLLLVNSANNGIAVWELNGTGVIANPQVGTMASGFHFATTGDFNGDGKTDLLMLNDTTHELQVWLMNGTQVTSQTTIGTISAFAGWRFAGVGDFNGDGKTDLLLLNDATHGVAVWLMNGTQVTANPQISTISAFAGWRFADIGDFNGDGKSDLLLLNDNTGGAAVWELNGTQIIANPQVGIAASGDSYARLEDINGDHKSDILFQNNTTHVLTAWEMNGIQIAASGQIGAVNASGGWHLVT